MSLTTQFSIDQQSVMEYMILALDQSSVETQANISDLEAATLEFKNSAIEMNEKLVSENKKLQALVSKLQAQQMCLASTHTGEVKALSDRVTFLSNENSQIKAENDGNEAAAVAWKNAYNQLKVQNDANEAAAIAWKNAYKQFEPEIIRIKISRMFFH